MRFDDRLIERIAENDSTLTGVFLTGQNIDDAGARKIAEALLTNTAVRVIDLSENRISAKGARSLAEMLRHSTSLTTLYLRGNGVGVEGARALTGALLCNATLARLDLGWNNIRGEGARALAGALPHNTTLSMLSLQKNGIGEVGARAFTEALRNNATLTVLDLGGMAIDAEVARELVDTLHFQNHSLGSLGLSFFVANDDVEGRIESYLEINRKGPVKACIQKTRLFPKSHLGNLTTKNIVLPKAVECLGHISGGLSVMFCFVHEMHAALLAFKNCTGMRKRKVNRIQDSEQFVE